MAEEEPVTPTPKDASADKPLRIRRGRVDSVDLYEIKDSELDLLEKGSPVDLYLNFAIFLISTAFSALASLCTTTTFKYPLVQTVFIVITVVGFLMGGFLLILWCKGRKDVSKLTQQIRDRIPPEAVAAPPTMPAAGIAPEDQPQPTDPKG